MRFFKILWEFPQFTLGMIFYLVLKKRIKDKKIINNRIVYFVAGFPGGISLSVFIFLNDSDRSEKSIRHEYGHTIQSVYLGCLYLIAVGIPSVIRACVWNVYKPKVDYYRAYPENWADRLGKNIINWR